MDSCPCAAPAHDGSACPCVWAAGLGRVGRAPVLPSRVVCLCRVSDSNGDRRVSERRLPWRYRGTSRGTLMMLAALTTNARACLGMLRSLTLTNGHEVVGGQAARYSSYGGLVQTYRSRLNARRLVRQPWPPPATWRNVSVATGDPAWGGGSRRPGKSSPQECGRTGRRAGTWAITLGALRAGGIGNARSR